jgi:hypothetical protein
VAFFDDMTNAVAVYPVDNVLLEIVDVVFTGDVFNVSEELSFKVKVTNTGPLNLTDVTLRLKGQHGAKLRRPLVVNQPPTPTARASRIGATATSTTFVEEFVSAALPEIRGHGGTQTSGTFTLKAPEEAQASQTLVKATIEGWNGNLNHILIDHSDPLDPPKATYSAEVVGS